MRELINKRIWDKENGVSYFCPICGQYKPEKEFYKDSKSKWGKSTKCRLHFTKREKDDKGENDHIKFSKVTERDFIGARKLLQKLGYQTTGDVTVHEQFKKRHNLK